MNRSQLQENQTSPSRCCIARGQMIPKDELIRFVVNSDGQVMPDLTNKLPGRGVYVSANRDALLTAINRKAFAYSMKAKAYATPALVEHTSTLLHGHLLSQLGLARKFGALVLGVEKIQKLPKENLSILIQASDASESNQKKFATKALEHIPRINIFNREELSAALGAPNVVYAAVITSKNFGSQSLRKLKITTNWISGFIPENRSTLSPSGSTDNNTSNGNGINEQPNITFR